MEEKHIITLCFKYRFTLIVYKTKVKYFNINIASLVSPSPREKKKDICPIATPCTNRTFQKTKVTTHKTPQNCDYIAIADQLRTVSCSNYSHPIGMVKPVYGTLTKYKKSSKTFMNMTLQAIMTTIRLDMTIDHLKSTLY